MFIAAATIPTLLLAVILVLSGALEYLRSPVVIGWASIVYLARYCGTRIASRPKSMGARGGSGADADTLSAVAAADLIKPDMAPSDEHWRRANARAYSGHIALGDHDHRRALFGVVARKSGALFDVVGDSDHFAAFGLFAGLDLGARGQQREHERGADRGGLVICDGLYRDHRVFER